MGLQLLFLAFKVFYSGTDEFSVIKVELIKDSLNTEKVIKSKLDSILTLKLQNDIQLVEKKNDGRFEVLTWSSVLVITLLLVFATINFIISSSKVKEVVDSEMDKKFDEIESKAEKFIGDIKSKTETFTKTYEKQLIEIEELVENAKKESEKVKDYSDLAEQIISQIGKK